jgi:vitamin B12 transporter
MKKYTLAAIACLISPYACGDDEPAVVSDHIVVTANRFPMEKENVTADVTVITAEDIEKSGQSSLTEILRSVPGVEVSSYGGLGELSSVYIRGTNANHTVVLLDGIRINSATSGYTLFEDISPSQIDHIEIVRGAVSSLYGSDAIGGVIQIFTKKGDGEPRLNASVGFGRYGTRKESAGIGGAYNDTQYALNVSATNSDGISPLRPKFDPNDPQNGPAAYRNLSVSGYVAQKWAEGHTISLNLYNSFNRNEFNDLTGTGPYASYYVPEPHAYEQKTQRGTSITSLDQLTSWWESKITLGEGQDLENSVYTYGSYFNTYQRQYSWLNTLSLPLGKLMVGYDYLGQHVNSSVDFTVSNRSDNAFLASYMLNEGPHSFQVSARRDDNSQFGEHDTGNISYGFRFLPQWRATGSWGTAFKAPTFVDLYWPGVFSHGNPNLKPETSENKELGLNFDDGHHHASATLYQNDIKNLIQLTGTLYLPENAASATTTGATFAYESWFSTYHFKASADFQDPRDNSTHLLLARRGREHGVLYIGDKLGDLELGAELTATGMRYDDTANQNRLAGYALLNLTAAYALSKQWSVNARLNNAFNKEYTTALAYGMPYNNPGTDLFVSLKWQQ